MVLDLPSDEAASMQMNERPAIIEGLQEQTMERPMLIVYEKKKFL